jgi:hypothetical protein
VLVQTSKVLDGDVGGTNRIGVEVDYRELALRISQVVRYSTKALIPFLGAIHTTLPEINRVNRGGQWIIAHVRTIPPPQESGEPCYWNPDDKIHSSQIQAEKDT